MHIHKKLLLTAYLFSCIHLALVAMETSPSSSVSALQPSSSVTAHKMDFPFPALDITIPNPINNPNDKFVYYKHIPTLHTFAMDKIQKKQLADRSLPGNLRNELQQFKRSIFTKNQKEALGLALLRRKNWEDFGPIYRKFLGDHSYFKQDPLASIGLILGHTKMPKEMLIELLLSRNGFLCARALEQLRPWLLANGYFDHLKQNRLLKAVITNDIPEAQKIVTESPDEVNNNIELCLRGRLILTPLEIAIACNNAPLTKLLSEKEAALEKENYKATIYFDLAVHCGADDALLKTLADKDKGSAIKCFTTLDFNKSSVFSLPFLIENGGDINVGDKSFNGATLLHKAVLENQIEIARYLLDHGADVTLGTVDGNTPLHYAAQNVLSEHDYRNVAPSTAMEELLISHGAQVNARNYFGKTPLHFAAAKSLAMTQFLFANGATLDAQDNDNKTPLFNAIGSENHEIVALLTEKGANITVQDREGNTPLHLAAYLNRSSVILTLIYHGADTTIKNNDGKTALNIAREKASHYRFNDHYCFDKGFRQDLLEQTNTIINFLENARR